MAEAEAQNKSRPLDDVMIAMDVVDTLRHDKRIVDRELSVDGRKAELIEELRKIYRGQGIDVPDHILEEGVKALEEKRFVYTPPAENLNVKLARIYVTRRRWGRPLLAAIGGAALVMGGWWLAYDRPRLLAEAEVARELGTELPRRISLLTEQISREATNRAIATDAERIAESARAAAKGNQLEPARAAERQLAALLAELRREYDIRIVNRQGEVTGLWRVPRVIPTSRNYYLVVEAIGRDGKPIERDIANEETGQPEKVTRWAVRVAKPLFDEVQADKIDDGIIQKAVLASKARGEAAPVWRIPVPSGSLTRW